MSAMTTPFLYHPTQVLLLDDDRQFLNLLAKRIDKNFSCVLKTEPNQAVSQLQSHGYELQKIATKIIQQNFDHLSMSKMGEGTATYDVHLSALWSNLSSLDRFKKNVVVVVDRHMPAMDGLKFCQIVKEKYHLPVKFILLTGATTVDEAVAAFNAGKIHAYIEKRSSEDMMKQLNFHLNSLAQQQFQEISEYLMGLLSYQFTHIKDDQFCQLFEKIRQEQNTTEYYLMDSSGSFLLLDKKGQAQIFLVRLEQDFEAMYDIAENSNASPVVLQALRERASFPFTTEAMGYVRLNGSDWDTVMAPMEKMPDRDGYYAVIDRPDIEVFSFERYLEEASALSKINENSFIE